MKLQEISILIDKKPDYKAFHKHKSNFKKVVKHSKHKITQVMKISQSKQVKISSFNFKTPNTRSYFKKIEHKTKNSTQRLQIM